MTTLAGTPASADAVVLAGCTRTWGRGGPAAFGGRILNTHPSPRRFLAVMPLMA
jgi:folate-dependent phosphoribosylglycinamide formyltransferase PurN